MLPDLRGDNSISILWIIPVSKILEYNVSCVSCNFYIDSLWSNYRPSMFCDWSMRGFCTLYPSTSESNEGYMFLFESPCHIHISNIYSFITHYSEQRTTCGHLNRWATKNPRRHHQNERNAYIMSTGNLDWSAGIVPQYFVRTAPWTPYVQNLKVGSHTQYDTLFQSWGKKTH